MYLKQFISRPRPTVRKSQISRSCHPAQHVTSSLPGPHNLSGEMTAAPPPQDLCYTLVYSFCCISMKNVYLKRTGQTVRPSVVGDRCVAWVVPSLLPKSSNSCLGYPSPHVSQGRATLEQIKIIKEDCILETSLIFVGIDVSKAQLDVAIRPTAADSVGDQ